MQVKGPALVVKTTRFFLLYPSLSDSFVQPSVQFVERSAVCVRHHCTIRIPSTLNVLSKSGSQSDLEIRDNLGSHLTECIL